MFQINKNIVFRIAANAKPANAKPANGVSNQWCYLSMSGSNPVLAIPSATKTTITIPDGIIWNITQGGAAAAVGFQMSQSTTGNAGQTYYLNCNSKLSSIELVTDNTETGTAWCCAHTVPGAGNGCFIFGLTQNGSSRFIAGSVSDSTGSLSALDYPLPAWPSSAVWSWGLAVKVSINNVDNSITLTPPINQKTFEFLSGATNGYLVFFMDPANTISTNNNPTNQPWTFTSVGNTKATSATMIQSYNESSSVTVIDITFQGKGSFDFHVVATNGKNTTSAYASNDDSVVTADPQVNNSGQSSGGGY
jgi:hypothetical protein